MKFLKKLLKELIPIIVALFTGHCGYVQEGFGIIKTGPILPAFIFGIAGYWISRKFVSAFDEFFYEK